MFSTHFFGGDNFAKFDDKESGYPILFLEPEGACPTERTRRRREKSPSSSTERERKRVQKYPLLRKRGEKGMVGWWSSYRSNKEYRRKEEGGTAIAQDFQDSRRYFLSPLLPSVK